MDLNPVPQLQAGLIMHENQTSSGLSPIGNSSCSNYAQLIFKGRINDTNPPDECSCNMDGSPGGRNLRDLDSLVGQDKTMIPHVLVSDPASKMSRCDADQKTNSFDESAFRATARRSGQRDHKKSSTECSCNMDIGGNIEGHGCSLRSEAVSTGIPKQAESWNLFNRATTSNAKDCKNLKRSKSGSWSSDGGNKRHKHTARKTYVINLIAGTCDEISNAEVATIANLGRDGKTKQHAACAHIQTSSGTAACSTKIFMRHSRDHAFNSSIMQPLPILNVLGDGVSSNSNYIHKKNDIIMFTASRCSSSAAVKNTPYEHCYGAGWLPGR